MILAKNLLENVICAGLENGADFCEVFVEDSYRSDLVYLDQALSEAKTSRYKGAGIRLHYGLEEIYTYTNDLSEAGLIKAAKLAAHAAKLGQKISPKELSLLQIHSPHRFQTRAWDYSKEKKLQYLRTADLHARSLNSHVSQVRANILERNQRVQIANSEGLLAQEERNYTRAALSAVLEQNGQKESGHENEGFFRTSECLDEIDFKNLAQESVESAERMLKAAPAPAGEFPVILENSFGGVIFHEACGHGLETTSVAKNSSVFCGLLGEKIAHECVTAIDDGTVDNSWGSIAIDDEGRPTQKTVLIENGVLKSYIVDGLGSKKTGYKPTGSGRRESYRFPPTSRMRNTYIAAGNSSFEEMLADVDFGLYAKKMGGGSVSPGTGDYNFAVHEAYLIRNGKLAEPVKGASLIGRGIDTLGKIVKVGNDLKLAPGMCGSVSGWVPVTVGQPKLLVSKIQVGGVAQ